MDYNHAVLFKADFNENSQISDTFSSLFSFIRAMNLQVLLTYFSNTFLFVKEKKISGILNYMIENKTALSIKAQKVWGKNVELVFQANFQVSASRRKVSEAIGSGDTGQCVYLKVYSPPKVKVQSVALFFFFCA